MIQGFTEISQYAKTQAVGKKTKKEKILAEYRRKLATLTPPTPVAPTVTYQAPKVSVVPVKNGPTDYSYVTADLRRVVILTALAICAQVVLWYLWKR